MKQQKEKPIGVIFGIFIFLKYALTVWALISIFDLSDEVAQIFGYILTTLGFTLFSIIMFLNCAIVEEIPKFSGKERITGYTSITAEFYATIIEWIISTVHLSVSIIFESIFRNPSKLLEKMSQYLKQKIENNEKRLEEFKKHNADKP